MSGSKRTTLLCVLDGFGLNPNTEANAVALANTPVFDRLQRDCPNTTLTTHGELVGLPVGQMGNSEVGHLTIGAGRTVPQWLLRIGKELEQDELWQGLQLSTLFSKLTANSTIHLLGLYSDGGVHSHQDHLNLLINGLRKRVKNKIALHLITDGRDTAPQSAFDSVKLLEQQISAISDVAIATVSGRFYAMDRDKRWERVKRAYDAIVLGEGGHAKTASAWIKDSYSQGINDEFIEPAVVNATPPKADDVIIFWNFRADRMREIVTTLSSKNFKEFPRPLPPFSTDRVICFANYDKTFGLPYLFDEIAVKNHLGEVIASHGLRQLRVAETEKYPHVTYFFNAGVEQEYPGESRAMVPSPRDVKTYDLKPEMSALPVTDIVVDAIRSRKYDFILVNLANCDMVGHTGVLEAAIKAVETVDTCLGKMLEAIDSVGGQAVIIADHGNAEQMINYQDGTPHTSHTTYPVPMIVYGAQSIQGLKPGGSLRDVAPTIVEMMNLTKPLEMTGESRFANS